MTWLEFISTLLVGFAWPLVVLVSVLVLRDPLKSLLPRLTGAKFKDLELVFHRGLAAAREVADVGALPMPEPRLALPPPQRQESVPQTHGRDLVMNKWREVESALRAKLGLNSEPVLLARVYRAASKGTIGVELAGVIERLRELRNEAAADAYSFIPEDGANEYATLADRVVAALSSE